MNICFRLFNWPFIIFGLTAAFEYRRKQLMEHRWWLRIGITIVLKTTKAANAIPAIEFISAATTTTFIQSTTLEFICARGQQSVPVLLSTASN